MLLNFAFRNVLRNKKRTLLTASAIFFASIIVVFAQGWMNGIFDMFLNNTMKYQTGSLKITTESFVKREKFIPVDEIIADSDPLIEQIRKIKGVRSVEERIRFGIILGRDEKTVFAFGMGTDLKNTVLNLKDRIIEGGIEDSGIYIGMNLARKLGVKMGDELLLATQTSEGGLNGIKLPIKGIFRFRVAIFDSQMFFVGIGDAKKLLKIKDGTTEIYVFSGDENNTPFIRAEIKKILPGGIMVRNVKDQLGNMYDFLTMGKFIFYFIEGLIIFLASFVVINTMMMAIFERLREIGTLKAMGFTDGDIQLNFIMEGSIIGTIGGFAGSILGMLPF